MVAVVGGPGSKVSSAQQRDEHLGEEPGRCAEHRGDDQEAVEIEPIGHPSRLRDARGTSLVEAALITPLLAERPWRGTSAVPARPGSQTLISVRNLLGCHGISSVNGASAVPKPVRLFTT